MDKKIALVAVAAVIAVVLGIVVFKNPQTPTPVNNSPTGNSSDPTVMDNPATSMPVKVLKIEGQKITYSSFNKQQTVTVGANTKIVKQVNDKGVFKDVEIKLSDIKTSQFIQIFMDSSGTQVKTIRVLP